MSNRANESDSDAQEDPQPKKQRIDWKPYKEFETADEKNQFFEDNPNLKIKLKNTLSNGTNTYIYCNVQYEEQECPIQMRLFEKHIDGTSLLLQYGEHHHPEDVYNGPKIDPATAAKIVELHENGYKPRLIFTMTQIMPNPPRDIVQVNLARQSRQRWNFVVTRVDVLKKIKYCSRLIPLR